MFAMFTGCEKLKKLDVSKWDVSSVEDIAEMFESCKSLESLIVDEWDLSSIKNFRVEVEDLPEMLKNNVNSKLLEKTVRA